tara:strand:+ start:1989 stop:2783 length:795 start_codon:yes stop_codon:yes gene_type:complete
MTKFTTSKDTRALHTSPMAATLALAIALTLSGCNMPSPFGTPTGSSMPSGPSGGTPAPSGDSGSDSSSPQGGAPSTSTGNSGDKQSPSTSGDAGGSNFPEPSAGQPAAPGSDESVDGLDETLDRSLEDFDDTVTAERNKQDPATIDILSPSGNAADQRDSNEPLFEEGDLGDADSSAAIEQRAAEGASSGAGDAGMSAEGPQGSSTASAGQPADAAIIPIPDDIGDGKGDNIVERQIRDAAEKEQDPVLREKLWDEYRRIKNQR